MSYVYLLLKITKAYMFVLSQKMGILCKKNLF